MIGDGLEHAAGTCAPAALSKKMKRPAPLERRKSSPDVVDRKTAFGRDVTHGWFVHVDGLRTPILLQGSSIG